MPRRARRPATPRTRSARTLRGAPKLPRAPRQPAAPPWKRMPAIFRRRFPIAPLTEWAVWWSLTVTHRLRPPLDLYSGRRNPDAEFLYQQTIPVPGLNQTGRNRPDFWVLPPRGSRGGDSSRGTIINPISAFTHPDILKDVREREVLATYHYAEIFIDEQPLMQQPDYLVGEALRGADHSSRA